MIKPNVTAHMIVKNEDKFIWYAISSVLPYVDKLLIFDTGSKDQTVKIIKSFTNNKIEFYEKQVKYSQDITSLRQEQVNLTDSDWFWIVDGDEIYSSSLCKEILRIVDNYGIDIEGIVVRKLDLLGDIYHCQDESVGTYDLFGRRGHHVLRLINKKIILGLHVKGDYPNEGYYDIENKALINHSPSKYLFTKGRIFHAMYLKRSSLGANLADTFHRKKRKIELGKKINNDISLPEIFNSPHPEFIEDSYKKRSVLYEFMACLITPFKIIKRKLWQKLMF